MAQPSGTVLVRHAATINGTIEGSIQQMLGENVTLNGSALVRGDLLVPGTPKIRLNGTRAYGGTIDGTGNASPTGYQVTLNGNASLRHVIRRTDPVALPQVNPPPPPAGTRNVALNRCAQSPGNFATLRNLTLNGNAGQVAVPPGTYGDFTASGGSGFILGVAGSTKPAGYSLQHLTLNGNARLEIAGPVELTLANAVTFNGHAGLTCHPAWLQLKVAAGNITLNGGSSLAGWVTAPKSTVILNGNSELVGALVCDRLTLNGNAVLRLLALNQPPTTTMTAPADGSSAIAFTALTLAASAKDPDGTVSQVEFFNGPTKLGDGTAAGGQMGVFSLPLLAGLPTGSYTFTARATDDQGATAVSAPVTISVTLAPNLSPQVAMTAPAAGATLVANAAVSLSATATDPDGAVAHVEFFDGATKLGEGVLSAAAEYDLNLPAGFCPGSHTLTARATDNDGAFKDSAPIEVTVLCSLPYTADFEAAEGYLVGSLAGQLGWSVSQGSAEVTDAAFFSGANSVVLAPAAPVAKIAQAFAPLAGQDVVFVDFYAKPVADVDVGAATIFDVESSRFALGAIGAGGELRAFNGDGAGGGEWLGTGFTVPLAGDNQTQDWIRMTVRLDFARKTWDLYAGGALVAADLNFRDRTRSTLALFTVQGHATAATHLDYVFAAADNPLFADADKDGMDDAWETSNGLNPAVNDRDGDLDGDGLSNIREYQLRLKPNNPDSDGDGLYDGDEVFWGWGPLAPNPDTTPPTAPAGLAANATTDAVSLTWQPATDNLRVSGYLVYRNGQPLETLQPVRDTCYTDTGLPDNESFGYQVRAFDFAGNLSPLSARVAVRTAAADRDGNGLPDYWEQKYFPQGGADPNADEDGDGITNLQEYRSGTDPTDFYNGVLPTHDVLYGGRPGPDGQLAMIVRKPDGSPWPNAPVDFDITSGHRRIAAAPDGLYSFHVTVRADGNGLAQCYLEPLPP